MALKQLLESTDFIEALGAKADDSAVVKKTGAQTIDGVKTFSSSPIIPAPTTNFQPATKGYVDSAIPSLSGYQLLSAKGAASGYAPLNSSIKVPPEYLPPLTYSSFTVVADQTARLALSASVGDSVRQTDNGNTYILASLPASTNANWIPTFAFSMDWSAITNKPNMLDWINVLDYGATGSYGVDDTDAIQAAINAAAGGSGVVYFPYSFERYEFTQLDLRVGSNGNIKLTGGQALQWTGNYGGTASKSRAILHCTASDDSDGIIAFQCQGGEISDLGFSYEEGYEGILLNIGGSGGVGTNTFNVSRCHFISDNYDTYRTAKAFVGLANIVFVTLEDCSFMGAQALVRGRETELDFSNCVVFNRCQFEDNENGAIVNPFINWRFIHCLWEFTNPDFPCALTADLTATLPGYIADIVLDGCWFWDFSAPSIQIPFKQPAGCVWDITVENCWFHNCDQIAVLDGPGSIIFEKNRSLNGVPASPKGMIDCGDPETAYKKIIRIVGNNWSVSGSQATAFINTKGHGSTKIENNVATHPDWSTDAGLWSHAPSGLTLDDSNTGQRYVGGDFTLADDISPGGNWEFHALAFEALTPEVGFPAAFTAYVSVGGTTTTKTNADFSSITLNKGSMVITKLSDASYFNVSICGEIA